MVIGYNVPLLLPIIMMEIKCLSLCPLWLSCIICRLAWRMFRTAISTGMMPLSYFYYLVNTVSSKVWFSRFKELTNTGHVALIKYIFWKQIYQTRGVIRYKGHSRMNFINLNIIWQWGSDLSEYMMKNKQKPFKMKFIITKKPLFKYPTLVLHDRCNIMKFVIDI